MADWVEVIFSFSIYTLYLLNYLFSVLCLFTLSNSFPGAFALCLLYCFATFCMHITSIKAVKIEYEKVYRTIPWRNETTHCVLGFIGWKIIFLEYRSLNCILELGTKIHKKLEGCVGLIKMAFILSFMVFFFTYDSPSQLVILILYLFLFMHLAGITSVCMQLIWFIEFVVLFFPVIIIPCICCGCCGICAHNNNSNAQQQYVPPPAPPRPEPVIQNNPEPQNNQAGGINNQQNANANNPQNLDHYVDALRNLFNNLFAGGANGANGGIRFGIAPRLPTFDALQTMIQRWKKKFEAKDVEFNPNCCVCLEEFMIDEEVVELHCNPNQGHIFHPECIADWSKKQRTCPLCRKDFVEIIRQEQSDGMFDEENKVQANEENKVAANDAFNRPAMQAPSFHLPGINAHRPAMVRFQELPSNYLERPGSGINRDVVGNGVDEEEEDAIADFNRIGLSIDNSMEPYDPAHSQRSRANSDPQMYAANRT